MDSSDQQRSELPQQQQQQHQPNNHHSHRHHLSHPSLSTFLPLSPPLPLKTVDNTPMSSPGLFSPTAVRHAPIFPHISMSESNTPAPTCGSPYLHPLQTHTVRETNKALIDSDHATGRKLINQYEVIEEIGRGMHGKVKLARNLETGENVAIKIIPRFSKKRRLGKVTAMSPQDKTKKEIAILKKIRHPNVVALLEVIDDPELKKIYMVLEHAELGEVVWRKKGLPHISIYERRRIEREMRGDPMSAEEERYEQMLERRQMLKEIKRQRMAQNFVAPHEYWSAEHGGFDEGSSAGRQSRIPSKEDVAGMDDLLSRSASCHSSGVPSRTHSAMSVSDANGSIYDEIEWNEDMETPGPLRSNPVSLTALDAAAHGSFPEEAAFRGRSPSMADSIISHMSSIDFNSHSHDLFSDDFSYVPCFTIDQARSTFRDTVLGLEYLHYQGVVHRDIKPANLLWCKDHRVKISDFGVSYFGRPIRDGEPDDMISESEAKDFDDDLELAKTVGTPAFFAPELCYTDVDQEQPKVSEQIDVWSLGVTLYCLIFARIPFLAEDEFQMFRKIATEDVYIPRRRLKPVDPSTSPSTMSLYKRHNAYPFRDDNDLEYEEVDNLLYDLLRQMLIKNPDKRIRLRDIKRHPWVVQGIANPVGWLDDTDPARPSSGRKIQVDERDVSAAVVPITFLDQVRSTVKKAIGKVIHPLVERSDSKSRRRAASSAASSAGESMLNHPPARGDRRRSLRPDDYFTSAIRDYNRQTNGHEQSPAAAHGHQSQSEQVAYDPFATVLPPLDIPQDSVNGERQGRSHELEHPRSAVNPRPRSQVPGLWRLSQHLAHLVPPMHDSHTAPATPACHDAEKQVEPKSDIDRLTRELESGPDSPSRSRSVDRGLFANPDKRAQPQVALSVAVAPGNLEKPKHTRSMRSVDFSKRRGSPSPLADSAQSFDYPFHPFQHRQPNSDPNMAEQHRRMFSEQISATRRSRGVSEVTSPSSLIAEREFSSIISSQQQGPCSSPERRSDSPVMQLRSDEDYEHPAAPSRGDTMTTAQSSSTDSIEGLATPLTSPSEVTSPVSADPCSRNNPDRILAFQSDPSLPALLSGASSISADMEAELLGQPGVVSTRPDLLATTDSLTPPALMKEPAGGFPIDQVFENPPAMVSGPIAVAYNYRSYTPDAREPEARPYRDEENNNSHDEEDDDDGIFLMAKPRKKGTPTPGTLAPPRAPPFEARRRDTTMSVISTTSTETARRVGENSDAPLGA